MRSAGGRGRSWATAGANRDEGEEQAAERSAWVTVAGRGARPPSPGGVRWCDPGTPDRGACANQGGRNRDRTSGRDGRVPGQAVALHPRTRPDRGYNRCPTAAQPDLTYQAHPNDPTAPAPAAPAAAEPLPPADILPADLQYKLIRRIGHGAYGEVYEAEAPGGVRVAVKRILRSIDHPAGRSELEALEAMKTVSHPFLLQTQAYWVYRDQLIIVMELAEGSLADRIESYKEKGQPGVPPEELIPYFDQAAEALDYLHGQNVSHRDIKPQNLLYLKGYAKVADFGLARVHEHTQTSVGEHIGTPMYMAPEAWGKRISLHSDQYSLAATYVTARLGRGVFPSDLVYELALAAHPDDPEPGPPPRGGAAGPGQGAGEEAGRPLPELPGVRRGAARRRPGPADPALAVPRAERRVKPVVVVAAALLCGLVIGGLAYWAFSPPASNGTNPSPPETLWCPPGWEPSEAAGTVTLPDGKQFHKQLTRSVGGEPLTAVAVAPARPTDPPLFYMTRRQGHEPGVPGRLGPGRRGPRLLRRHVPAQLRDQAAGLLPGEWKKGAFDLNGENLGIDGAQQSVPVVNVTVPEAGLVADELGGQLPTPAQWAKAVGVRRRPDPDQSGRAIRPTTSAGRAPKGLALGLERGPWPVERATPDVSVHGLHQLISNGYEWTRETSDGQVVNLFNPPLLAPRMAVVGQTWELRTVHTFVGIATGLGKSYPWDDAKSGVGFRARPGAAVSERPASAGW